MQAVCKLDVVVSNVAVASMCLRHKWLHIHIYTPPMPCHYSTILYAGFLLQNVQPLESSSCSYPFTMGLDTPCHLLAEVLLLCIDGDEDARNLRAISPRCSIGRKCDPHRIRSAGPLIICRQVSPPNRVGLQKLRKAGCMKRTAGPGIPTGFSKWQACVLLVQEEA